MHRTPTSPSRLSRLRPAAGLVVVLALAGGAMAAAPAVVKVRRGDTLWEFARDHHTTVRALQELNNLKGSLIYEGQTLRLRPTTPPARRAPARAQAKATTRVQVYEVAHLVKQGDSLIRIARRYGVAPDVVAARNKLPRSRVVMLGQRLMIPQRRVITVRPAVARATTSRAGERVSRDRVRALLRAEARRRHVDPNLVLALAVQESGLQQHVVSSTGALGVMQVMPGTGEWTGKYLVGRRLDLRKVEDNITAGVAYLRQLLRIAKSEGEALAGYYQGLASVRSRGYYEDTKRYVSNILALRTRLARR
jgi:soluble lytic murein transglycosylase-like protein